MTPDDERHGTNAGYVAGCREQCCRDAAARYERGREWDELRGKPRLVSIVGARRRIEALQSLGWSAEYLSQRLGYSRAWLNVTLIGNRSGLIYRRNFEQIAALYDELSMSLPPTTRSTGRQRNLARQKGYAPPLAWNDIDNESERPRRGHGRTSSDDVDPVVVERLLAGQRIPATTGERHEAMRRWKAQGRSEKSLCEMHGWRDGRYGRDELGAAS